MLSGGRGGLITAAAAAVLVSGGGAVLLKAALDQQSAPEPPLAVTTASPGGPSGPASPRRGPSPSAGAHPVSPSSVSPSSVSPSTMSPSAKPGLPRSPAVRITIARIGVRSDVQQVGLDRDGAIAVPRPGPHYDEAAWFTGSPAPGQVGPSVLVGHVDSARNGPSVFFRLGALVPGDEVRVTRADGRSVQFQVYRVDRYHKNAFPTAAVYANTAGPELRLITCGGTFNSGTGHYEDNVVVYARQD